MWLLSGSSHAAGRANCLVEQFAAAPELPVPQTAVEERAGLAVGAQALALMVPAWHLVRGVDVRATARLEQEGAHGSVATRTLGAHGARRWVGGGG